MAVLPPGAEPPGKKFVLNLGSFVDPPTPTDDIFVVGVDALPEHVANVSIVPHRYMISAAVGERFGLAHFRHYRDSSSLLEPDIKPDGEDWTVKGRRGALVIVPTLPLTAILDFLHPYECLFIKTDLQGMDYRVLKAAGRALQRCSYIRTEVYCGDFTWYKGAQNSFERHLKPFMNALGFETDEACEGGEWNIVWHNVYKRDRITKDDMFDLCPRCFDQEEAPDRKRT